MKIKKVLLSCLLLALWPYLAFADSQPGAVTFTLGSGYLFFALKRDLKNNSIESAALAYNFDEKWAMVLTANLINANSSDPSKHHVHGFIYLWDMLYRLSSHHGFDPYLLGGFNVVSLKPISSQPINQGGVNLGLGTQFFKSRGIALSLEARDLYTFSGGKNDILLNAGVNFIWE